MMRSVLRPAWAASRRVVVGVIVAGVIVGSPLSPAWAGGSDGSSPSHSTPPTASTMKPNTSTTDDRDDRRRRVKHNYGSVVPPTRPSVPGSSSTTRVLGTTVTHSSTPATTAVKRGKVLSVVTPDDVVKTTMGCSSALFVGGLSVRRRRLRRGRRGRTRAGRGRVA